MMQNQSIGRLDQIPQAALWLGLAGALPFLAGGVASSALDGDAARQACQILVYYGAVILSFLGGIRWGSVIQNGSARLGPGLGVSIVPALVAWIALLLPESDGLALLAMAFVLCGLMDGRYPPAGSPTWFTSLRLLLTAVVGAILAGTLIALMV